MVAAAMQLNALQTFLAILETGSLVKASERLHVTQSTVSARLKGLEDELGQTLLNRYKSGVTPTSSGLRLKRYAETMVELWRQARQETALPQTVEAVCNIGCHADLWPGLARRFFDHVREAAPAVALSVWHGGQNDLATWQTSGLTDVSFTYWPVAKPRQTVEALAPDRLVLVSTTPGAPASPGPGYVFVEAGEEFGRRHAAAFADAEPARFSFGSATLGLEYIRERGGSAYLPDRIADPLVRAGALFPAEGAPVFERPAYLVWNDDAIRRWPWFAAARSTTPSIDGWRNGAPPDTLRS